MRLFATLASAAVLGFCIGVAIFGTLVGTDDPEAAAVVAFACIVALTTLVLLSLGVGDENPMARAEYRAVAYDLPSHRDDPEDGGYEYGEWHWLRAEAEEQARCWREDQEIPFAEVWLEVRSITTPVRV